MASRQQAESWIEETICPICLEFFTDPVTLDCGHNFCRSCISQCWEKEKFSCPECREEFPERNLRINRPLASLAEKARKLKLNPKKKESKVHCEEHQEELKLFCETDKKLICYTCVTAEQHRGHRFLPIKEAAEIYKNQLKSSLDSLTLKKSAVLETELKQKGKISEVREQSSSLQTHITSEFSKMYQILTEKEQRLLRDLREEEERILETMEKNFREIQENLNSIEEKLSKLQKQMEQKDELIFLKVREYIAANLIETRRTEGIQEFCNIQITASLNQEVLSVNMASRQQLQSLSEEAICPICLDFFIEPATLDCGHNFCRSCITQCWEKKEINTCPECGEEFPERNLRINWALGNLAEKARNLNLNPKEKESKLHCEEHQKELKLFCETDKKLICLICENSKEHKSHNFLPIKKAAENLKVQLKSSLDSLTVKKSVVLETEQKQKLKISEVREQSSNLQTHITSEFSKMHQILTEKKQRLLRDLREEEERILEPMEKNLRGIRENLNSIEEKLSKLQKQMEEKDELKFLKVRG
ncbi:hypothetical protein scyTo_0017692 [Scyliorhinus torazame]|uniref:Uncharacterized protein n=1 Tax=Scyliorhinus torazame TaxID=75743 RepID=A0A401PY64_SCYTO|nr:hypothetical protein [Scyliorhinus torazame]